ncbi:unnamed protein product, partial [Mesorhabditis spiculigera]
MIGPALLNDHSCSVTVLVNKNRTPGDLIGVIVVAASRLRGSFVSAQRVSYCDRRQLIWRIFGILEEVLTLGAVLLLISLGFLHKDIEAALHRPIRSVCCLHICSLDML